MSILTAHPETLSEAVERLLAQRACCPRATYRLQFEPERLSFPDAAALVPYLDRLGISHLYASPCLKVRSGAAHGYAIVEYDRLDPALGGPEAFHALVEALHTHEMGQILDIVPNHMSATPYENAWWTDVLENGPSSPYAAHFDIEWHPVKEELQNKLLLPMLGKQYGQALEAGELKLEYRQGVLAVRYYQTELPLDPRTYGTVLGHRLEEFKTTETADAEDVRELESILTALQHLPDRNDTAPDHVVERQREKEVIKERLQRLTERSAAVAAFLERNLHEFNGTPDDPHSFDLLDRLLDSQVYRLSHWKAAADEINYRRFFDINDLAAICTEDAQVFEESHRFVFELLARRELDGLRVDHIDGLYDPMEYVRRLQEGYVRALGQVAAKRIAAESGTHAEAEHEPATSDLPGSDLPGLDELAAALLPVAHPDAVREVSHARLPLYVVVEKILGPEEPLPDRWLVAGTTGYDYLNCLNGLFLDPAGVKELLRVYHRFVDQRITFAEVAHQSKRVILREAMASDLQLLARRLNRISERHRGSRDFTLNTLRVALREILACFPVYRTYIREGEVSERDRQVVHRAVAQAKQRNPATDAAVFDFVRGVLLLEQPPGLDEAGRHERELFVGRFQQVTSPVMAKGIEDTAFYRYFPLVSLNEVGGTPARHAVTVEEFHQHNLACRAHWPHTLLSTTTHDTKRSEDVRARIDVLSEVPLLWRSALNRWARLNRRHRREVDGEPAPSRGDEYLFYQNLIGIWPLEPPDGEALRSLSVRMQGYMEKATHEAKLRTSWISPNAEYDTAVREFVAAALDDRPKNTFLSVFRRFHEQVVNWGLYNALAQTVLKLTSPGVPDLYQGQELWDFSLVDPDNRRPVDFARREQLLSELEQALEAGENALQAFARQLAQNPRDPRTKLFLIWRTLQFRRRYAELFRQGQYIPLKAVGSQAKHVCAYAWRGASSSGDRPPTLVVIAPRLIAQLTPPPTEGSPVPPPMGPGVWGDTHLAGGELTSRPLKSVLTGQIHQPEEGHLPLGTALADFPVALLSEVTAG